LARAAVMHDPVRLMILKAIYENLPSTVITKIEFEGPEIAVYVKDRDFAVTSDDIIRKLAKTIKKRIVLRIDEDYRLPEAEARKRIAEILLQSAPKAIGNPEEDLVFDDVLGEVVIKTSQPTIFLADDRALYKYIFRETGWRPVVVRKPPLRSEILEGELRYLISKSDYRKKFLRRVGERIHRVVLFKDDFVRITALGGFREVGRSAILVETAESKVLLDFGFNAGAPTPSKAAPRLDVIGIRPDELDAVVVTHAHLDHCGLIPYLFKYGFDGPVYATQATRDLMVLLQIDLLQIAGREGKPFPYDYYHIRKALLHTIPLRYHVTTDITSDIRLTFYEAGHILGSAMAHLHIGDGMHNIVYTGDFKFGTTRLLNRAEFRFPRADTLIMESTYGNKEVNNREDEERRFIELIKKTIERGGKVLIPTLAVGRAQEVMLILVHYMRSGELPEVPVYVEGMINEVTAIHTAYPEYLSREVREMIYRGENPFMHPSIRIVDSRSTREEAIDTTEPVIIMATSGMLTGGPAVEYFYLLSNDPKNTLIFVNYQVEGTLGRKVLDAATRARSAGTKPIINIPRGDRVEPLKIEMEVHSIEGFSGHSDRRELLNFVRLIYPKPRRIILNHGEPAAIEALRNGVINVIKKDKHWRGKQAEVITPGVLDAVTYWAT